ncbi:MAG: chromosomal replication initiator protein DnaA [Coriobacteriia bacterium]|nr:chromosomal replication initiator protein DnaA [Coriobacteriia bacterium]
MGQLEATTLWDQVYKNLLGRQETNNPAAEAYLSYLVPQDLDETTLTVVTELAFAKQWIEARYLSFIDEAIVSTLGSQRNINIVILDEASMPAPSAIQQQAQQQAAQQAAQLAEQNQQPVQQQPAAQQPIQQAQPTQTPQPAQQNTTAPAAMPISTPTNTPVDIPADMPSVTSALSAARQETQGTQQSQQTQRSQQQQAQQTQATPAQASHSEKTFDTYIVGSSNDFAFSASQGVAEMPGLRFNPLFIYGRSGLGKTHLLLAIKDYINRYHPERKVVFAQTSEFVNDFTSAMASINKDLTDFRIKYHMCDVLLLDDVQYLEGKESTTNALFDIFNLFIAQHKQIVLSADRAPNELNLDERFASRFAQGLTAGIQPPSFEMKMAIFNNLIKYYCYQFGVDEINVPQEVADHIIGLSSSNIRELEGATSTIVGYIAHHAGDEKNTQITIEAAEQIVGTVFLHNDLKQIDVRSIQRVVENHYGISHADMVGSRRSKNISFPRQVAMYLSRRLTTKSFPEIGKMFGGKDHTSVLYAHRNIEQKIMKDINRKIEIERLAELIMN